MPFFSYDDHQRYLSTSAWNSYYITNNGGYSYTFDPFSPFESDPIEYSSNRLVNIEKTEEIIMVENGIITATKSFAYGCESPNRPITEGDFVAVNVFNSDYNDANVVMEVAKSYLVIYRFKYNDVKTVRPQPFVPYIPNNEIKNKVINRANEILLFDGDDETLETVLKCMEQYPEIINAISFPVCSCCGKKVSHPRRYNDKIYCSECYDNLFVDCARCGNVELRENTVETREGYRLCKECGKYHYITSYHRYYPKVNFFGNNHKNTVPYLGFELEIDEGGESDKNCTRFMKDINKPDELFAYCSHDGSLHDGFEIITHPATMEYHNSIKDVYANAFANLKKNGYMSHDTTTCGFHVHFNRSYYGADEQKCIRKLLFMTEKFWNELVLFARRPEQRMERYAKKIEPMEITEYMRRANKSGSHEWHYYSVNLSNNDTIEFRMFRGSLNVNTVLATLQLVNNMVIASKEKTPEEISNMKFEDLLTTRIQKAYWKRHSALPDTEE